MYNIKPRSMIEEVLVITLGLGTLLILAVVGLVVPKVRAYNRRISVEATYLHSE